MLFTTNWLTSIFENYQGEAKTNISIQSVMTDSRQETANALFIPIKGDNFDGHDYIEAALKNGAVATIWNKNYHLPSCLPADFPVFLVDNTLVALQKLASVYRREIDPIVIGITGSNGKTTTKDLVTSVVKTAYHTHFTHGNLNNHIGMPLTILSMDRETEVLVLEMGMNHFGEIDLLTKIATPDYAIITNIGESHIEYLGSRQGIAKAKLEIRNGLKVDGTLIIDGDEPLLEHLHKDNNIITCGYNSVNDVEIERVTINHNDTTFSLLDGSNYKIPLLGEHHAKNATYAITIGKLLHINHEKIQTGLMNMSLTSMRFEMLAGISGVSIINDAYNASPTSMKAAINVVKQMKGFREKILVLGDILELGGESIPLHQSIAEVIEKPITNLITYGDDIEALSQLVQKQQPNIQCVHFDSKEEIITYLQPFLHKDALLLFKASRGLQFEKLVAKILG